ncbi:hypothetical protein RFI_33481 [Reticulomyxa filosa]|uniref:Uncharacterized protein n=1 Tax=Reticulomyxa filosa TaxID=46433 RepID=X6LRB1_RETFI|nr:hypothetical protein RFI_33481 [Reticulomyxa filosa]|eukprot:ETO03921.1 hypothetical protein RFI_33481 [Reticulomyxa filosa]
MKVNKGNTLLFEMINKGYKSIRSLEVTIGLPTYRMRQYPSFPHLVHLRLTRLYFDDKLEWINPTKFPNLQCLTIEQLCFACNTMCFESLLMHIENDETENQDLERKIYEQPKLVSLTFTSSSEEIELVNSILQLCPHLLALNYEYSGKSESMASDYLHETKTYIANEGLLQIPPTLEWLWIKNLPCSTSIDLSRCKRLSGIRFYGYI